MGTDMNKTFTLSTTIALSNGVKMPALGLGTFQARGEDVEKAVISALNAGYRHIDTASIYRNEENIGTAIARSGVPRNDIFITSKVSPAEHGYKNVLDACAAVLKRLGTDYLDLYLIHWPGQSGLKREDPANAEVRKESWRAMEFLYSQGTCKAIGVSNYNVRHLEHMSQYWKTIPHVNQFECHLKLTQNELREWCFKHGIVVEAYSSLAQGTLLTNGTVLEIAKSYKKTPAQILLRWGLQQNMVVIPKSITKERIIENADLYNFELRNDDVAKLSKLNNNRHICWDPTEVA